MDPGNSEIATPITVSEACHILESHQDRYKDARSAATKIFRETLEYTKAMGKIRDKGLIDSLRQSFTELGFTPEEIAVVGSLLPQSSDEAKIYLPSISRLDDSLIEQAIAKIRHI